MTVPLIKLSIPQAAYNAIGREIVGMRRITARWDEEEGKMVETPLDVDQRGILIYGDSFDLKVVVGPLDVEMEGTAPAVPLSTKILGHIRDNLDGDLDSLMPGQALFKLKVIRGLCRKEDPRFEEEYRQWKKP
jgi:hypothetical protein